MIEKVKEQENASNNKGTFNKKHDQDSDNNSQIIKIKEQFYEEDEIAPDVQNVLDEIFAEMVQDEQEVSNIEDTKIFPEEEKHIEVKTVHDSSILVEKKKIYSEEDVSPAVQDVLDKTFDDMMSENTNVKGDSLKDKELIEKNEIETNNVNYEEFRHKMNLINELEATYVEKIAELKEKIKILDEKTVQLGLKKNEYEDSLNDFKERSKELEESRKEFEERLTGLTGSKQEMKDQNDKLKQAREQFIELSKQLEIKKDELNTREVRLNNLKKSLEFSKSELEESRLHFEKNKRNFVLNANQFDSLNSEYQEQGGMDWELSEDKEIEIEKEGKVEILKDILENLQSQGDFQSCFLIDGKGMLISEYSKIKLDPMAIGAMFSLICNSVLRTVKNLNLNNLEYFKLSSANGEFILRNIKINNYERNFILIASYDESNLDLPNRKTLNKKAIKTILKHIKRDFKDIHNGRQISLIFDNLTERIEFLKQKYSTINGDINLIRLNLLNKASLKIIELFEEY